LPAASVTIMPLSPMSATWVRAQAFGQPLRWIEIGTSGCTSARRFSRLLDQPDRPLLGLDDRELAELDAGARHGRAPPRRRLGLQPDRVERRLERVDLGVRDVEHDDLLLRGEPDPTGAGPLGGVGEGDEGGAGDASRGRGDPT
jgi:hypothetical protein